MKKWISSFTKQTYNIKLKYLFTFGVLGLKNLRTWILKKQLLQPWLVRLAEIQDIQISDEHKHNKY